MTRLVLQNSVALKTYCVYIFKEKQFQPDVNRCIIKIVYRHSYNKFPMAFFVKFRLKIVWFIASNTA